MLVLRTLGSVELERSGRRLRSMRQDKRLALLVYLAANNGVELHRRDKLLALFWPELSQERARHALRQSLYYLREQLGPSVIAASGEDVRARHIWCDVPTLRTQIAGGWWEAALGLYRGDFLEGFHVAGLGADFEEWVRAQRLALRGLANQAAIALIDRAETAADLSAAAGWARRAIAIDPMDEYSQRRLLTLLDRNGDRAGAVASYDEFEGLLRDEYELDPSPETRAVIARIRARTDETGPEAAAVATGPLPGHPPPAADEGYPGNRSLTHRQNGRSNGDAAAKRRWTGRAPSARGRRSLGRRVIAGVLAPERLRPLRMPGLMVAAGVLLLIVLGLVALGREAPPARGNPRIAVLPFDIRGGADPLAWRDVVAALVAGALEAGGLDAATSARALRGAAPAGVRATPAMRKTAARRLGADLFIAGEVRTIGAAVRLSGQLFDTRAPTRPLRALQVEGTPEQVPALAQRLTVGLIAQRGEARALRVPTYSTTAMHLYLVGQGLLGAGRYDDAGDAFRKAVGQDSAFALAWYCLSVARDAALRAEEAKVAAARAALLVERLPRRERALVSARAAYHAGDAATAERLGRGVVPEDAPDAGASFWLGETYLHLNPLRGRGVSEARAAFERVVARAPAHAGALAHLAELAARDRDWEAVGQFATRALAAAPESPRRTGVRLLLHAARNRGRVDRNTVASELELASDRQVVESARTLAVDLGDLAAAAGALELLEGRSRTPGVRAHAEILRGQLELARGRRRAADALLADAARLAPGPGAVYAALLVRTPGFRLNTARVSAARSRVRLLAERAEPPDEPADSVWAQPEKELIDLLVPYLDARLSAMLGERAAGASLAELDDAGEFRALAQHYARVVRALLDPTLDPLPGGVTGVAAADALASPFFSLPDARYAHAERLARAGDFEHAAAWFSSLAEYSIPDLVLAAPAHLRRAELAQALGRAGEAAEEYRAFLALWQDCDPELRPLVRYARRALATLVP